MEILTEIFFDKFFPRFGKQFKGFNNGGGPKKRDSFGGFLKWLALAYVAIAITKFFASDLILDVSLSIFYIVAPFCSSIGFIWYNSFL